MSVHTKYFLAIFRRIILRNRQLWKRHEKSRKRKPIVDKLNLPSKSTVALCHRAYSRSARVNRKRMYLQSGAPVTFSTLVRLVRKGSKVEECLRTAPPSTYITRDILKKAGVFRTSLPIYQRVHLG